MAELVWDATGTRFYEMGISNGVLYPMKADGTYDKGVAWNGLTSVTESPDGAEVTDLWADDIKYGSLRSVENFKGTIEAYTCPEEFYECDGSANPTAAPGLYFGEQTRKPFGLVYKTKKFNDTATESDDGYLLHIVYGATCSPSERQYQTINDSPEAITFSWEFETTPVVVNGYKPVAHVVIDSKKANATKLTALEAKLFGSGSVAGTNDPQLPDPATLITDLTPPSNP